MNKKLSSALLFLGLILSTTTFATKYYWVQNVSGTNTWNTTDSSNWALFSNGPGHMGVPGVNDTAYFDANSFAGTGGDGTVTMSGNIFIHTIDFSNITDNPNINSNYGDTLNVYGSMRLEDGYNLYANLNGTILFKGTKSGINIDLNGQQLRGPVTFAATGGSWVLQSNLATTDSLHIYGKLTTAGHNVSANDINSASTTILNISAGSIVYVYDAWNFSYAGNTLNMATGSSIVLENNPLSFLKTTGYGTSYFYSGGLHYKNVEFSNQAYVFQTSYYDTLKLNSGTSIFLANSDSMKFNVIVSYETYASNDSIVGQGANPAVLYDLNGGMNCLNYMNFRNITATGKVATTYNSYGGSITNTTGITQATPLNVSTSAYKASTCATAKADGGIAVTASGGIAPYIYSWSWYGGVSGSESYIGDTIKTASADTFYNVTVIDACFQNGYGSISAIPGPDDVVNATVSADTIYCKVPLSRTLVASTTTKSPVTYSWSPSVGLSRTDTSVVVVTTPAGGQLYSVTMTSAACSKTLKVNQIVENPKAIITRMSDTLTVCEGSVVTINAGTSDTITGFGKMYTSWSFQVADFSNILKPRFKDIDPLGSIIKYTVTVYGNNNCQSTDSVYLNVVDSINQIYGTATYDNGTGPITKGYMLLYKDNGVTKGSWPIADTVQLKTDGTYAFDTTKISSGNYIIRVVPDPVLYPRLTAMYYIDKKFTNDSATYYWDSSTVVLVSCGGSFPRNFDLDQLPDLTLSGGKGVINGTIKKGPGYIGLKPITTHNNKFPVIQGSNDAIGGVGVGLGKKPNPSSNMIATTTTDTVTGFYQFNNVPPGSYVIFADIPGLPMDSTYNVTVTAGYDSIPDRDYFANDSVVYINPSLLTVATPVKIKTSNSLSAYPNPYSDKVQFDVKVDVKSAVTLEIYDLLGNKIATLENAVLQEGNYKYTFGAQNQGLAAGIYVAKLTLNNTIYTQRLVELKQ